jgi:hypothetical protein
MSPPIHESSVRLLPGVCIYDLYHEKKLVVLVTDDTLTARSVKYANHSLTLLRCPRVVTSPLQRTVDQSPSSLFLYTQLS